MSLTTDIPNHAPLALARLPEQYKNAPNISGFLTALMGTIQKIEGAFQELRDERLSLASGVVIGANLDLLGSIVGAIRQGGESDTQFLNDIYVAIAGNISQGDPESILRIFNLATGSSASLLSEFAKAEFSIMSSVVLTQTQIDFVFSAINVAIPVGTKCVSLGYFDPLQAFSFLEDNLPGGAGFADDSVPGSGGIFATDYLP